MSDGCKASCEHLLTLDRTRKSDRCEDAREYYDFLMNKKIVRFHAHPTRCDPAKYPEFELVLSSRISYDALSEKVGDALRIDPTHLRFFTVNGATGNPRTAVKRAPTLTLHSILTPTGYGQLNMNQRTDALYFEVLDMSLAELDRRKNIKIIWLSEGITKEDHYDCLVSKNGNVDDLIQVLTMKAQIPDESEAGRIRVYEVTGHKFFRELPREHPVISINDYTSLVAERVPEEEVGAEENQFIQVFHFQNEPSRAHGMPFKFLLKEVSKKKLLLPRYDIVVTISLTVFKGREVRGDQEAAGEADGPERQELREDQVCGCA